MEKFTHSVTALFQQLGLPAGEGQIDAFIHAHASLAEGTDLADAPFWSPSQAAMLREQLVLDADWAVAIDQLNLALRQSTV